MVDRAMRQSVRGYQQGSLPTRAVGGSRGLVSQDTLDGLPERGVRKRLGQERADPDRSRSLPRLVGVVGTDEEHRDRRDVGAGVARDGEPVDSPGQTEIRHDEVRSLPVDECERVESRARRQAGEPKRPEKSLPALKQVRLVVHQQNGSGHCRGSPHTEQQECHDG